MVKKLIFVLAITASLLNPPWALGQTVSEARPVTSNNFPSTNLSHLTGYIASQLATNSSIKHPGENRVAIASFVDLDSLEQTSQLGSLLAENLMHEMHVRGFAVVDYKIRDSLKLTQRGDLVFSRDIADLKRGQDIHYFLSGTIALNADGAVINVRMIDTASSLIKSSAQGFISKRELQRLLNGEKTATPVTQPIRITLK